jgi:hypothetical protein
MLMGRSAGWSSSGTVVGTGGEDMLDLGLGMGRPGKRNREKVEWRFRAAEAESALHCEQDVAWLKARGVPVYMW